jgi:hypothetical protein
MGHSIPLGIVAGAIVGVVWARMTGGSTRVLTALAVGSIVLHDVLDLLQDGQRMPFWPLSDLRVGVGWLASSDRLWWELLVFGLPFAIYETWRVSQLSSFAALAARDERARRSGWRDTTGKPGSRSKSLPLVRVIRKSLPIEELRSPFGAPKPHNRSSGYTSRKPVRKLTQCWRGVQHAYGTSCRICAGFTTLSRRPHRP